MDNAESTGQTMKSGSQKFILPLIFLSVLIIAGAGAYMFLAKNNEEKQDSKAVVAQTAPSPTSGTTVIASIKEALAGSQSLQCDFSDDEGRQVVSYIKSGMIRSDITAPDPKESMSMIMKEQAMYFWNGKTGTKMSFDISQLDKITPLSTTTTTATEQNPQDFVAAMEKYKESCNPATVSDALFTPPTDVKFTDLSSMMKKATDALPSGGVPSGLSEEQMKAVQDAMQQ